MAQFPLRIKAQILTKSNKVLLKSSSLINSPPLILKMTSVHFVPALLTPSCPRKLKLSSNLSALTTAESSAQQPLPQVFPMTQFHFSFRSQIKCSLFRALA